MTNYDVGIHWERLITFSKPLKIVLTSDQSNTIIQEACTIFHTQLESNFFCAPFDVLSSLELKLSNDLSFCRSLRKSTSIPVHLTVSTNNEVVLPPGLRPHSTCHLEHEPDCAALKQNISEKWSSAQSLPTQIGTKNRRGGTPCGTPTGETLSSLQKKKFVK